METVFVSGHYIFLSLAAILLFWMVSKMNVRDKVEHFVLGFFLMTGQFNTALTFKIPGVSFFEVQPARFLFLLFSFYIFRKLLFSKEDPFEGKSAWKLPTFMLLFFLNAIFVITSFFVNLDAVGMGDAIVGSIFVLNFGVIVFALRLLLTKESIDFLGKTILIGAIFTCFLSFFQIFIDPTYLHIGEYRIAFGNIMRANGMFTGAYFNCYYMIIAIIWILATMKNGFWKYLLIAFLGAGVFITFLRMGWLVLAFVVFIYFLKFERPSLASLSFIGLGSLSCGILVFMLFFGEIMNSSLVKERIADTVDGRKGYTSMVIQNFGKKPLFGYGNQKNEVYFANLMQIAKTRERATGEEGDIHSGYFSTLFFHGVPAFLFLILFWFSTSFYFYKLSGEHLFFSVPFLVAIMYIIANLTSTFTYEKYLATLFAIHIGLGWSARYLKDFYKNDVEII